MEPYKTETPSDYVRREAAHEAWKHWPVNWTAIAVGTLVAVAVTTIFGLIAVAIGAHQLTPEERVVDLRKVGFWVMAVGVFGSFFAFVIGGWAAGKVAGILHSEPAILHGAIVWLAAIPLFVLFSAIGTGGLVGSWYGGLSIRSSVDAVPFVRPEPLPPTATEVQRAAYDADWAQYRRDIKRWKEETPRATRNAALFAITALLIGLMGSVVGGWMASGEPMSISYKRPVRVV